MKGLRSKGNYYMWISQPLSCMISKVHEIKLWNQRLGHLHLKGVKKVIYVRAIRGLPNMKIQKGKICGECEMGKKTNMSCKNHKHLATSKVLELLYMELTGPMQVESLGWKRYVFVCLDDFSIYTWVNFIREKLILLWCWNNYAFVSRRRREVKL